MGWAGGWAALSVLTIAYAVIVGIVGVPQPLRPSFDTSPIIFSLHISCGAVALFVGLLQFNRTLRLRHVVWHRRAGMLYLGTVAISGFAGLALSGSAATGTVAVWGFRLLAIFWLVTTFVAWFHILRRDITLHREWMIRSFSLTLAAVSLRLELAAGLMITQGDFNAIYPVMAWACWVPNLVLGEMWIRLSRRDDPTRRVVDMIRNMLAVVVGLVVGMVFNMAMVILDTALHPMPEGVTFEDAEGVAAYFAGLPLLAFLIILVAHVGQAFVGGLVAAAISRNASMLVAMIVGALSLFAGIMNMMSMPLPAWMWIEMPLYLFGAWLAARIVLSRRSSTGEHPGKERIIRTSDLR